jgi:endonuclease-3 related protein
MVGAILTQNTSWSNVEKAIANLRGRGLLNARRLYALTPKELARLIRPAGYYNLKAQRLRNFLGYFIRVYGGSHIRMAHRGADELREELLGVSGIGPETADSILLYALNKPAFVVDSYTKRILSRHKLVGEGAAYGQVQELFTGSLRPDPKLFNEYHALLVRLAKDFCRSRRALCEACPLGKDHGK